MKHSDTFHHWTTTDQEWFVDLFGISNLLRKCIIDRNYKVSDEWRSAIALSPSGNNIARTLTEKHRVKPNDAAVAVFLHLNEGDTLFVERATNPDSLRRVISADIMRDRIRFPYTNGRSATDLAYERFVGYSSLNEPQTKALLNGLPRGVFQEGRTVVGPMGAFQSKEFRALPNVFRQIPGYLCSDINCDEIHAIALATGRSSVSRAGEKLAELITKEYQQHNDADPIITQIVNETMGLYSTKFSNNLFDLIFEELTDFELRNLVDVLARSNLRDSGSRSELQKQWNRIIKNPTDSVDSMSRPEAEQAVLYFSNAEIIRAIDVLVADCKIIVPSFTSRRSRFSRFPHGYHGLSAEIGTDGVRFKSSRRSSIIERLAKLIEDIYLGADSVCDADELTFALEIQEGRDPSQALSAYLRTVDPEKVLEQLVFSSLKATRFAAEECGISDIRLGERSTLRRKILWKLGANSDFSNMATHDVISAAETLASTLADLSVGQDALRGAASNVFVSLEDLLQRALSYTTWALTNDHYADLHRFTYDLDAGHSVLSWIEEFSPTDDRSLSLSPDGKNTLVPLAAGFSRLAKALSRENHRRELYLRDPLDEPFKPTMGGKRFEFRNKLPALNLTDDSLTAVIDGLREITGLLQGGSLIDCRNRVQHGNAVFPSRSEFSDVINAVRECASKISAYGFSPNTYRMRNSSVDKHGREEILFEHGGMEVTLFLPTVGSVPGMPIRPEVQLIMPICEIADLGPLRFRISHPSPRDDYWLGYPPRLQRSEHDGPAGAGGYVTGAAEAG
ncbi:hypothetical protein ACXN1G_11735 [Rhodococcus ruber]